MPAPRLWIADAVRALALALLLGLAWAARDWAALSHLRLPDTDDLMRLQQVRDWLAGQPFSDLTQHRLGPAPGVAMHWSRLGDLGPAALIAALAPLAGRHAAEIAAVTMWPPLLFAATLFLVARIARAAGGDALAGPALLVAAVAHPATGVFVPGRIDHHGLQIVLLLAAILPAIRRASLANGLASGLAAAAGLAVGLETAPLLAALGLVAVARWIAGEANAEDRLMGLGVGIGAGMIAGALVLGTDGWAYPACDGFDRMSAQAVLAAALAPVALAMLPPRHDRLVRTGAALAAGLAALAAALWLSPGCRTPYGAVDPLLARLWLSQVAEAQPLLAADAATAIGQAGLMIAGIAAGAWLAWRRRTAAWFTLLAVQLAALAVTFVQLRGVWPGTIAGVPALAALVVAARARGALRVVGAWLASAGIVYPLAAQSLPKPAATPPAAGCDLTRALPALAALPPATILAPIDLGPAILAATPHRVLAGPYHRNAAGNRAALAFFLGDARRAQPPGGVNYVLWCPGAPAPAGSTAAALVAGATPPGLAPPRLLPGDMRLYRPL